MHELKEFGIIKRKIWLEGALFLGQAIYNLGILAHVDAGKTTLTEQLLYEAGALRRAGRVDDGTAQTDWLEVERRRGISVRAASSRLHYRDAVINIIDTPGHVDFAGEVERSLAALDCAILLLSAVEGVQAQSRQYWEALRNMKIPALLVINKTDRIGSDVQKVLSQAQKELDGTFLPITRIANEGEDDCKIVQCSWEDEDFREEVLLTLAEINPEMENALLEERYISSAELKNNLTEKSRSGEVSPVFMVCAKSGAGCRELLAAVMDYLPPAKPSPEAPLSGVIFKVDHDPVMGKAAHIRLFGGMLKNRDAVPIYNPLAEESGSASEPEKATQIRRFYGAKAQDVGEIRSGDIGAVYGLSSVRTGDIVGKQPLDRACHLAVPLLQVQAFPEKEEQLPALAAALRELSEEDPLLDLLWLPDERELHLKITGVIQLEILTEMIQERYGLTATFSKPSVIYKETPAHAGIGFEAYTMPKPCWAVVKLAIEPLPRGSGIVYSSAIKEKELFYRYQNHVRTSVFQNLKQGVYGWEVTDAKITLIGGEHHTVHTHPLDFFVATPIALMDGLTNCGSILLEPMLTVRLSADESLLGRILGDILAMRGKFDSPVISEGVFTLEAQLPAATSLDYPITFRSMTSGKGIFSSRFAGYQECPLELGATAKRRGINPLDRSKWILWARNALQ